MSSRSLCCRTLRRLLLRVLFREMVTDDTAAYRADHGVMAGVMPGDATDDSALKAASGVCRSDGCQQECCCDQTEFASCFHVVCTLVLEPNPSWRRVARFQPSDSPL
jgi:hypothetical protein